MSSVNFMELLQWNILQTRYSSVVQ